MKINKRLIEINPPPGKSVFLWGPRKTGKTWWVSRAFHDAAIIDLLKTDILADYISRPALLRERYQNNIYLESVHKVDQ